MGVIARETRVAGVTVRVVDPKMLPDVAIIVVLPTVFPYAYACPPLPVPPAVWACVADDVSVLIAATLVSDELQVTDSVRSFVVLSEYVPVAVSCWLVFFAINGLVGITSIARS